MKPCGGLTSLPGPQHRNDITIGGTSRPVANPRTAFVLAAVGADSMPGAMAMVALLFGPAEPPFAGARIAGVDLIERQARQVRHAGAARVFVLNGRRRYDSNSVNLDDAAMLGPRLQDDDTVLVLGQGLVVDDRIIAAVMAAAAAIHSGGAVVATWPAAAARRGVERLDALTCAAGVAIYPAALVRRIAMQLGDWDLHSTLLRAALGEAGCGRVDLTSAPVKEGQIAEAEQRRAALTYTSIETPEAAESATATVLAATIRIRSDAPGRFLFPVIEQTLLLLLAPTRVSPQVCAALTGAIGIAAALAFGMGWLWTALALALLFGPLQDIGERLAEARVLRLRWRQWRGFNVVIGYGWWLAFAARLVLERGNGGPLAVAALLLLAQLTELSERRAVGQGAMAAQALSAQDRQIMLWAASRDSLALLLIPFALAGLWYAGLWYAGLIALAGYAVSSAAAVHARFLQRVRH